MFLEALLLLSSFTILRYHVDKHPEQSKGEVGVVMDEAAQENSNDAHGRRIFPGSNLHLALETLSVFRCISCRLTYSSSQTLR